MLLDQPSRAVLARFAVTLAVVLAIHALGGGTRLSVLALAAGAGVLVMVIAQGERMSARSLNRWDEVTAWLTVWAAASVLGV